MEYITEIYNVIIGSTLYTIIAIAFLILIGYGIIKKLFKLVLIAIVCLLGYLGYIAITEGFDAAKDEATELYNQGSEFLDNGEDAINNLVDDVKNNNSDTIPLDSLSK